MNNKKFIIGIDPGAQGGIVSLTNGKLTTVEAMPSTIQGIWDHFLFLGFPKMIRKENTYVYIENVHSMPTDSRISAFSFGRHIGQLDTIFHCMGIEPILVAPQSWMVNFNLQRNKEAGESRYDYKRRLCSVANMAFSNQTYRDTLKNAFRARVLHGRRSNNRKLLLLQNGDGTLSHGASTSITKSATNKLTLKTCDAYLIALYGYYQQTIGD